MPQQREEKMKLIKEDNEPGAPEENVLIAMTKEELFNLGTITAAAEILRKLLEGVTITHWEMGDVREKFGRGSKEYSQIIGASMIQNGEHTAFYEKLDAISDALPSVQELTPEQEKEYAERMAKLHEEIRNNPLPDLPASKTKSYEDNDETYLDWEELQLEN